MLVTDKIQLSQKQAMIDRTLLQGETRAAIAKADSQAQSAAIAETKEKAATTRQLLTQLRADKAAFKARFERLKPYVEQGALAKEQLFEAEQALRDRTSAINQSQGDLQQALAQANQLQAGLIQKQASGRTTQLETIQLLQQQKVEMTQVKVKLDAYGIVPGRVISISPDAKRDERLGAVYRVEVALDRNSITAKHQTIKFKPGQTASADIIIRRRRIADILLEPFRQLPIGGIDLYN